MFVKQGRPITPKARGCRTVACSAFGRVRPPAHTSRILSFLLEPQRHGTFCPKSLIKPVSRATIVNLHCTQYALLLCPVCQCTEWLRQSRSPLLTALMSICNLLSGRSTAMTYRSHGQFRNHASTEQVPVHDWTSDPPISAEHHILRSA